MNPCPHCTRQLKTADGLSWHLAHVHARESERVDEDVKSSSSTLSSRSHVCNEGQSVGQLLRPHPGGVAAVSDLAREVCHVVVKDGQEYPLTHRLEQVEIVTLHGLFKLVVCRRCFRRFVKTFERWSSMIDGVTLLSVLRGRPYALMPSYAWWREHIGKEDYTLEEGTQPALAPPASV